MFAGFVSLQVPAGRHEQQVIDTRRVGQTGPGEHDAAMDFIPGAGIDFAQLALILLLVLAVYVFASIFGWCRPAS